MLSSGFAGNPPVIFIHYGGAPFLRSALRSAKKSNPRKKIFLLGDDTNRDYAEGVAECVPYADLCQGPKALEFLRRFRPIQGSEHRFSKLRGTEEWLRFVFLRWFCIEELLRREQIGEFWTFDSDTLLLADLAPRENRFRGFAATTQCRGRCLNGWVGSPSLVSSYTQCMLDLFRDENFLRAEEDRVARTGLAFNEMDAFVEFRRRSGATTWHAAAAIDGEAFDDALAITRGYETSPQKLLGKTSVKRLWCSDAGGLYAREADGSLTRLLSCNMSWMPTFMWRRLSRFCLAPGIDTRIRPPAEGDLREVGYQSPPFTRITTAVRSFALRCRRRSMPG